MRGISEADLKTRRASYVEGLARLEGHRVKLRQDLAKIGNDIHATRGAIQDCDYWLTMLRDEGRSGPVVPAAAGAEAES